MDRHLGKNVVIVLALVAAGFLVAWLRFRPWLGSEGRFSDGVKTYDVAENDAVRYAVWERPTPVAGDIDGPEGERRPALSPDGRWLVFTVGERGLGQDLWVAEMVGGQPRDPRPLGLLNSDADDAAPAFAGDALLFASDRIGTLGGLDLYRAPYSGGIFGEPERIQGGLNSTADDTDPAPVPGTAALAFASDRGGAVPRHFDLLLAKPAPPGGEDDRTGRAWNVTPLDALNTGFQEREPAFTADGRHLFFASDREGGEGGYDLYRSALAAEGWVPPVALAGVNSEVDERAPLPSADGFELLLERGATGTAPGAVSHLERARSVELFRQPGRPVGWRELLVLGLLLLLALLAWLAKRWEELEVLYKCLLVSLVVHALLMWWFRDVYPEGSEVELRGRGDRMRVRLVAQVDAGPARNVERGGELEVARAEADSAPTEPTREALAEAAESVTPPAPTPGAPRLVRGAREAAAAPERDPVRADAPSEAAATAEAAVAVRSDLEHIERRTGAAAALEVAVLAGAEGARAERSSRAPAGSAGRREVAAAAPLLDVAPAARRFERARPEGAPAPRRRAAPVERGEVPARTLSTGVAVATPAEVFERRATGAAVLELEATADVAAPERSLEGPSRAATDGSRVAATLDVPVAPAADSRAVHGPEVDAPDVPARSATALAELEPANLLPADGVRVALEDVESTPRERSSGAAAELELGEAQEVALDRSPPGPLPAARRSEVSALELPDPELVPSRGAAGRLERPRRDALEPPRRRADLAAPPTAPAETSRVALETPVDAGELRPPAAADLEPGLARTLAIEPLALAEASSRTRRATTELAGPTRRRLDAPRPDLAAPAPGRRALEVGAPEVDEVPTTPAVARWEHTPYQTRSGVEKLRALDLFGGSEETEAAVAAGLAYLAGLQRADGYWGSARDRHEKYRHVAIGKTGLATLAFLGAGHTPGSGTEHADVVARAVDFLLTVQDERTGHFGNCSSYGHGIATYALAECFALTGDERLRAPLDRAVARILSQQNRERDPRLAGGWGYYYPDGEVFDRWPRASVTAWQVMALESARLGGLEVPDRAFAAAKTFLANAWDAGRGAYRYSHDPSRLRSNYDVLPGSTPASLFALSLLGDDVAGPEFSAARAFVMDRAPERYRRGSDDAFVYRAVGNLYFWYYGTLAMFRVGGDPWRRWNVAMQETLLPAQEADGSWRPVSTYAIDYAGDDDEDRSYTTAMCVLSLEIYYRYFTPLLKVE